MRGGGGRLGRGMDGVEEGGGRIEEKVGRDERRGVEKNE